MPITGGTVRPGPLVEVAEVWTADGVGRPVLGRGAVALTGRRASRGRNGQRITRGCVVLAGQQPAAGRAHGGEQHRRQPTTEHDAGPARTATGGIPLARVRVRHNAHRLITGDRTARRPTRPHRRSTPAGLCDSPRRRRDVTLPGMARQGWGVSIATAIGVAAGAGAAQLGFGYGLGVITWTPTDAGATDTAWADGLAWATWLAASSTVLGAVCAQRLHQRNTPAKAVISAGDRRWCPPRGPAARRSASEHESPVDGSPPAVDTAGPEAGTRHHRWPSRRPTTAVACCAGWPWRSAPGWAGWSRCC